MVKDGHKESDDEKLKDINTRRATGRLPKKATNDDDDHDEDSISIDSAKLPMERATQYRQLVARANYLTADRPDLMFRVEELARSMSSPCASDWNRRIRLSQYLNYRPRCVLWYPYQMAPEYVVTMTDSDWAGCRRTRGSTTGGALMMGLHFH